MRKVIVAIIYILIVSTNSTKAYANKLEASSKHNTRIQSDNDIIYKIFATQNV